MYCIKATFDKIHDLIKGLLGEDYPKGGNYLRPGPKPKFTDIEVIALSITAESLSIDSENRLFKIIETEYTDYFPISRRQYNDRRKALFQIQAMIRQSMANKLNEITDLYAIDSMPLEICKLSRMERNKMGKDQEYTQPDKGFCASQNKWYYGYKLHGVCSPNGVIQSLDLTKASVHDINYLKDVSSNFKDCIITGDRGYVSKTAKAELWERSKVLIEVPYRHNQKDKKPILYPLKKVRKRIETVFSQLCDQFMIQRNYAKSFPGYKTRIMAKISGLTTLQYINRFITHRPVGRVKYALCY